jgi:hypothetical protein
MGSTRPIIARISDSRFLPLSKARLITHPKREKSRARKILFSLNQKINSSHQKPSKNKKITKYLPLCDNLLIKVIKKEDT